MLKIVLNPAFLQQRNEGKKPISSPLSCLLLMSEAETGICIQPL